MAIKWKFRSENYQLNAATLSTIQTSGSFIDLPLGITHYELSGPTNSQLTVLIPGFSVPYYIWEPTVPALVVAGIRTLCYDLYGRGYSDRPYVRYDEKLFEQQLESLLDALNISEAVNLVGLSMGGAIAVYFAAQHPRRVNRLVLIDPAGMQLNKKFTMKLIKFPITGELIFDLLGDNLLVSTQLDDFYQPERFAEYPKRYREQMKYQGFKAALLSTFRSGILENMEPYYRQVGEQNRPVLLIWGREDRTVPFITSQLVLKTIPNAEFHPIEKVGHIPHYEKPEIVNPILIQFLKT